MRLWETRILPYLPNSQLLSQWRECNSIFKNEPKHILINYVYEYDKVHLLAYTLILLTELETRDIHIKNMDNFNEYFKYTRLLNVKDLNNFKPFPNHHTNRYLLQNFYNLQEKFDRGQLDFGLEQYQKLERFIKKELKL